MNKNEKILLYAMTIFMMVFGIALAFHITLTQKLADRVLAIQNVVTHTSTTAAK